MKKISISTAIFALSCLGYALSTGCTNADLAQLDALGKPGHIRCYSGGQIIYEGDSNGKIKTEEHSDGWYFQDAKTGKLVRVSGACVIEN